MRDTRIINARLALAKLGIELSDEQAATVVEAVEKAEGVIFEKGDFVCYYEGMGEMGHGTVKGKRDGRYLVEVFQYNLPDREPYDMHVTLSDMRELSSVEEAMEYFRIRSGGK